MMSRAGSRTSTMRCGTFKGKISGGGGLNSAATTTTPTNTHYEQQRCHMLPQHTDQAGVAVAATDKEDCSHANNQQQLQTWKK